ncbi:uncharacterized protein LOC128127699 [Lactuca sativa]|uniref:uncharacterized protein LOC128127699 n=1 Tax=Lactuca sativa TaxID=4236 RepID=UPI0022AF049F|nr:uncharacterized protein LOC128127699 [Lactuca sativa]
MWLQRQATNHICSASVQKWRYSLVEQFGEQLQLTWEEFLVHFKRKYCSARNLLELENQFLTLNKGSMSIDEYTKAFIDKMEFALRIVPNKPTKVDKYSKGFPWEYVVPVRQEPTLEASIWAAKSVEEMIKGGATSKVKGGEKRKFEGSARSNKKNKPGSRKSGEEGAKQNGYGKPGHYANEYNFNKKVYYWCNEEGNISRDCSKKKEAARPNVPSKPKARAFQMILEAAMDATDVASCTFLVNELPANILFDSEANNSFISHKFGGRLVLHVDKLDNALVVEVVSGKFIPISNCIKNIVIDLNGNKFHVELLPIELNDFDVVLGMDWLSANDAEILCKKNILSLDFVDDPGAVLDNIKANHIANKRSLFYQAYALYYEKLKKFTDVEKMYHLAVQNLIDNW